MYFKLKHSIKNIFLYVEVVKFVLCSILSEISFKILLNIQNDVLQTMYYCNTGLLSTRQLIPTPIPNTLFCATAVY